jgi:hypothetical protein
MVVTGVGTHKRRPFGALPLDGRVIARLDALPALLGHMAGVRNGLSTRPIL